MNKFKPLPILANAEAVIFDMDGLLVDSEPLWKIAEKNVFGALGLDLDDELLRQVMGFRLNEVVEHWYHYQPWPNPDLFQTELDILNEMEGAILNFAVAMPGVFQLLETLRQQQIKLALASSSSMRLIHAVLHKLNIRQYFDVVHSAEYEPYGKPHPGIFITTAEKLKVNTGKCVVLEDSVNGVLAAKAARMKCIAVPESATFNDPRFVIADMKVSTLDELLQLEY